MGEDSGRPENHAEWWSRDAMRWAACRPAAWAQRQWSGLALIVAGLAFMGSVAGYAAAAAALVYGWVASRHRRATRRRQRLLAANAARGGAGLRVLVRRDDDADAGARTWVYAADDTAGERPLFSCSALWTPEPQRERPLREAVLLGAPCDGARLVLIPEGHAACAAGPVRPVSWQAGREPSPKLNPHQEKRSPD